MQVKRVNINMLKMAGLRGLGQKWMEVLRPAGVSLVSGRFLKSL